MKKHVISLFMAVCIGHICFGQETAANIRSASFESIPISQILNELGDVYDVQIFFEGNQEFERVITLSYEDKELDEVLERLLKETTYTFVNYREYARVIMPRTLIEQDFSSEFYQAMQSNLEEENNRNSIVIGSMNQLGADGMATITGVVRDIQTNEPIIGASVQFVDAGAGTITNIDGTFELSVNAGKHELLISSLGFADFYNEVNVLSNGTFDVSLDKGAVQLEEVTIRARAADARISGAQIGVETIDIKTIEKLPSFLGEVDVMKSFLLQPGVSSIGEGSTGFNVRGGNVDQNLILQDQAELFNSSHALGFFSTFNTDLIQKVELYKANVPARYGGRLVSVMNVEMKDGDFERFKVNGGIGPVSSRIALQGPIVKDKVSFIVGFRSAYTDWVLNAINNLEVKNSESFFYDANARITIKPNEKHTVSLSGYQSFDDFVYNQEFGFEYQTQFAEFNYKAILSDKVFSDFSVVGSKYKSDQNIFSGDRSRVISNNIDYVKATENVKIVPNEQVEFNVGAAATQYYVDPGTQAPLGDDSNIDNKILDQQKGRESAVYGDATINLGEAFTLIGGARFTFFQFLGPHNEYQYSNPDAPRISETTGVELKDGSIATYSTIEPRLSARLKLSGSSAIKAGYSRTSQYINQIFNGDTPTPTSLWQLSTRYIQPLRSHNASIGVFKNMRDNAWETSLEFYARKIDQQYDYVDFAQILLNEQLETDLRFGEGRAYGAELSIKKNKGVVNGWLSYTYGRSERRIEEINRNDWYLTNFDKTHDVSFIFNFEPNQRNTLTANFNYSTGRPTTPPLGTFTTNTGVLIPIFANRSSQRIPDYMRLDLSYTLGKGYRSDQKFRTSWTLSLYNVLGRKNAFTVFYTRAPFEKVDANKLSVLGGVFPSLTVNFELL